MIKVPLTLILFCGEEYDDTAHPGEDAALSQASLKLMEDNSDSIQLLLCEGGHHHLLAVDVPDNVHEHTLLVWHLVT